MGRLLDGSWSPRLRPGLVDVAVALLLFGAAALEVSLDLSGPIAAKVAAVVLTTLPLAWRSAAPVAVVAVTAGGFALAVTLGLPASEPLIPRLAPLVAVYSAGVHSDARGLLAAYAIALVAEAVAVAVDATEEPSDLALTAVGLIVVLAVGRAVRTMGFEADTFAARAAELERDRDERARAAVAAERARIARELHDLIGHSISVMGVQAGAVRRVLDPGLEREREALLAVERTGRDAVTEVRRLLGFLRSGDEQALVAEPPPTLGRLDDLVAEIRRAGLDVDLRVDGELADISAGRALAAFRIVQEALTNALRHAPGAHVSATLGRVGDELHIEVADDGDPRSPAAAGGGGFGLVGMRERVAMYGGTLEAGPRPGGGFAVVARLPTADE